VNYERTSIFRESDVNNASDQFGYSSFQENYTSSGIGINLKLGVIFKPAEFVRIGVGVHSPSVYGLKDQTTTKMVTDVEQLFSPSSGLDSVESSVFGTDPELRYDLVTPWKFLVSGSYVFREAEDVSKQRGFITADVEYATYGSSRFTSADDIGTEEYYNGVNDAVKEIYKGAVNVRIGGELKFKTIMTRLGFARYGKPYNDKNLKGRRMNISGGLGYRNKGIFVDLTYVHSLNKDVHFPYRLEAPRANTFADVNESNGNVLLTVGVKF
jgi:long-subunit fatty acid transport protein